MNKRIIYGLGLGGLLGIFCIIGAQARSIEVLSNSYLFGFWFNRFLMGFVIGLLPSFNPKFLYVRGILIGLFVSFAFYASTEFFDLLGFLVGGLYGIIIEYGLYFMDRRNV